ncbi:aminotransferase class I/II-fold pyridoxal phosphate-dependent enzyme [Achromobacter seleniivolatilans]|uniref:Aminotransferase class I/II-fold pyridoxal phosphate-dependent enzyme n=1 Tax=Achromobacter seleniivolatilans TaxID=3047478 RepID=A0ABY9M1I6_9BURK|nr:aminotransferase class I/II-fold pyridoxal phosphate-dependent enzyme [Achromobacter sp. R39]WMD20851.1 aminotransferase class I/II-fold pyridoxal phosphate-dependent enzyme [Achromobacter sp. R39]
MERTLLDAELPALYLDAQGNIPQFESVRQARAALRVGGSAQAAADAGMFAHAVGGLVFGDSRDGQDPRRFLTHPAASGTHALTLGAQLLAGVSPARRVYLPTPSWGNYQRIFEQAGFAVGHYPYFNAQDRKLDVGSLVGFLCRLPAPAIIVLQASCHNPTGSDLNRQQWDVIADVIKALGHTPFIDMAYQGLGETVQDDNYGVAAMASRNVFTLVAQSCSKIFQLSDARCGSLNAYCPSLDLAQTLQSTMQAWTRANAVPGSVGVVARILNQPGLRKLWQDELLGMRDRVSQIRAALHKTLCRLSPAWDWSYLTQQRGFFSYDPALHPSIETALNAAPLTSESSPVQARRIVSPSGRLGISLITEHNLPQIAHAIAGTSAP